MNLSERQSSLISELSAVRTREDIARNLSAIAAAFSLRFVTLLRMPDQQDRELTPLILETTQKISFFREFDRQGLISVCPLSTLMRTSLLPCEWSLDAPEGQGKATTDEWLAYSKLVRAHDIAMGVMVSLIGLDGHRLVLRYDGRRPRLDALELSALMMVSMHVFQLYGTLHPQTPPTSNALSARELEVVRWTAQGKTSAEIGRILSLSDHTVNAYLNNAIRKLDCVNRTQLVAKAIRLKLIA